MTAFAFGKSMVKAAGGFGTRLAAKVLPSGVMTSGVQKLPMPIAQAGNQAVRQTAMSLSEFSPNLQRMFREQSGKGARSHLAANMPTNIRQRAIQEAQALRDKPIAPAPAAKPPVAAPAAPRSPNVITYPPAGKPAAPPAADSKPVPPVVPATPNAAGREITNPSGGNALPEVPEIDREIAPGPVPAHTKQDRQAFEQSFAPGAANTPAAAGKGWWARHRQDAKDMRAVAPYVGAGIAGVGAGMLGHAMFTNRRDY